MKVTDQFPTPNARRKSPNPAALVIVEIDRFTGEQDGRLLWDPHWFGATLTTRRGLTERQQLAAIRWAVDTLEERRLALGEFYGEHNFYVEQAAAGRLSARPELPVGEINALGLRDELPECGRCSRSFYPESSPALDLCWQCSEDADAEAGR